MELTAKARVVEEKRELDHRLEKLQAFCRGQKLHELGPDQKSLLLTQLKVMTDYSVILGHRLYVWGEE